MWPDFKDLLKAYKECRMGKPASAEQTQFETRKKTKTRFFLFSSETLLGTIRGILLSFEGKKTFQTSSRLRNRGFLKKAIGAYPLET